MFDEDLHREFESRVQKLKDRMAFYAPMMGIQKDWLDSICRGLLKELYQGGGTSKLETRLEEALIMEFGVHYYNKGTGGKMISEVFKWWDEVE